VEEKVDAGIHRAGEPSDADRCVCGGDADEINHERDGNDLAAAPDSAKTQQTSQTQAR
jgi:hypothetical protein